jgi:Tol biopolymer transport system component
MKEFIGKKTMRNLFRIYLLYLILFINITFWSCDSKIEPFSKISGKLPSPNDSTIVFVTMGVGLGWHIAVSYDYKKIYNLSLGIFDINAYWSPDKKWLVYNRIIPEQGHNLQLWRMQFDGSGKQGIILPPYDCGAAKISSDGSKIVFASPIDEINQILVSNSFGQNIQQITNKDIFPSIKNAWYDLPSWSSDGQNILFTYGHSEPDSNSSFFFCLASINLPTKAITVYSSVDTMYPHNAQWSPVRDEIVFVGKAYPAAQIYRINTDGTGLRKLTDGDIASFPDWSSDGEYIIYDQPENSNDKRSIWVMDRNDNNKRKLISIEGQDCTQPVW